MDFDSSWMPLEAGKGPGGWNLSATPCGLRLVGVLDWAAGTPLWAVLDGIWSSSLSNGALPDWTDTAIGREILHSIVRGDLPIVDIGHPAEDCGALYCSQLAAPR